MTSRSPFKTNFRWAALLLAFLGAGAGAGYFVSNRAFGQPAAKPIIPHNPPLKVRVEAENPLDAGKYLVLIGACNDCHTPGWMEKGLEVPETEWLVGVPIGWHGKWGTNYASNLRRYVKAFSENDFVAEMHTRNESAPMPWASMHAMPEADLRAMYKYIKSLKPLGKQTPASVDPGEEPRTAYYELNPIMPRGSAATPPATKPAQ